MIVRMAHVLKGVTEGGRPLSEVRHVRVMGTQGDHVVLNVESGRYHFESTGGIHRAAETLKTSKPADTPLNQESGN